MCVLYIYVYVYMWSSTVIHAIIEILAWVKLIFTMAHGKCHRQKNVKRRMGPTVTVGCRGKKWACGTANIGTNQVEIWLNNIR